ncbi:HAMP domain-containing protein, partial [Massilia arenosa]
MLNFERSSLSQKLSLMSLLATGTALVLVFIAFAVSSVIEHRREERMQLESLSAVIGDSTLTALRRQDWKQANVNLEALKAMDGISAAALYDQQGKTIARYGEADGEALESTAAEDLSALTTAATTRLWTLRMRWYRPVVDDTGTAGAVMIESSLAGMWREILRGLGILGAAMVGSLAIAIPFANRFRGSVSEPVAQLIAAARKVASGQSFGQRIAHSRRDELGTLIDSFNAMLAQIEERGTALANHRNELERQVGVRTEQLEKAKNAAEAASRAKSAFLATMSHEIRTPMNGVLGMIEMLLATQLTEMQRNYASMVRRSGEHLLVIINDILDFSKIEAGKLTIEYIHFNLHDLLDDIDSVYRPQAHAKGVSLYLDVDPSLPLAICGDPNRLRQILSNLLGNAIKFTDSGEIRIRVRLTREDEQAAGIRFEVHDTGIGISREARSRIFEAFSQADNSTTRKYGGTGLGLAISKQLVELMGGRIGVENALTQGSVFWFEIAFDKRRVAHDRLDAESAARLRAMRVLLLDEQEDTRTLLARQLDTLGIEANLAASSYEAVDVLVRAARQGVPYDVAFIDTDLHGNSGLAFSASLKGEPALVGLRIVLLASARTAADPVQRREAGAACQLVKPPRLGDLLECLLQRAPATNKAPA